MIRSLNGGTMRFYGVLWFILCGILVSLVMSGCSNSNKSNDNNATLVTVLGRVDDGTATSPIANAQCRFINRSGSPLATITADGNGEFDLAVPPDVQGFIGCNPPDFPNLTLVTFVSTVGIAAGETIPEEGREEVSPPMTLIANNLVQTATPDPEGRKAELLAALEAQDPDL
jgi:hypothetical protein